MDKSVLVVDDDDAIRNIIVDYLAEQGYLVYESGDGPRALEILERDHPSLMLLDLRLIKMSGLDVLKKSRQVSPDTVVVILSGNQEEGRAKEAIRLGAYDYLAKPISLQQLKTHILDRVFVH
ncbi:MAG: response regulator [Candidatus Omnitrophica bacterium]|nr:response regulator [Candidatus Omnitrophota bacterium]